ncbi:Ig-like V-type domain-containing protein FAM187A [Erpetoichthys calabaricus]|uniref:Family with sequence similarity 187 member A n=1 Tax=Erpetoichthys calabaricus TaxID=27687 RepID=A0A8C4T8P5_ERPCA|nr:Ig-like V-type domain-containing protein FAM187A [Erpetoichthys calabaricus]
MNSILSNLTMYMLLLLLLRLYGSSNALDINEEKEDVFAKTPCPAFLVFDSAAYIVGMTIELPCKCKPEDALSVVWYYQKNLGQRNIKVLTDLNGTKIVDSAAMTFDSDLQNRFLIRLFNLLLFRTLESDSGHYICGTSKGDFFYGYDVDIQEAKGLVLTEKDFDQPANTKQLQKTSKYSIFTSFWSWSVCDRCDISGEQTRVGICYIESEFLYSRYRRSTPNVASCGSASVPNRFKRKLKKQMAVVSVRSCLTACPPEPKKSFAVKMFYEFVGLFSKNKEKTPSVPIQYHLHHVGYPLILACPGSRPQLAIAWDKDKERLYRSKYMIGLNKSMRIFIDQGNNLNIRFVQLDDKGIYYCWLQGKMIAGFKLSVSIRTRIQRKLSDSESIYAMRILLMSYIFLTIVFLGCQIITCCCEVFSCRMRN